MLWKIHDTRYLLLSCTLYRVYKQLFPRQSLFLSPKVNKTKNGRKLRDVNVFVLKFKENFKLQVTPKTPPFSKHSALKEYFLIVIKHTYSRFVLFVPRLFIKV